jgi:hypothetical protein
MARAEASQPSRAAFRTIKAIQPVKIHARITAAKHVVPAKKKPQRAALPQVMSKPDAPAEAKADPVPQTKSNGVAKVKAARVRRRRAAKPRVETSSKPASVSPVVEESAGAPNESAAQGAAS